MVQRLADLGQALEVLQGLGVFSRWVYCVLFLKQMRKRCHDLNKRSRIKRDKLDIAYVCCKNRERRDVR